MSTAAGIWVRNRKGHGRMEKISGMIGLGQMGEPMAENLLKKFSLVVYDLNPKPVEALKRLGATSAKSPQAVAEKADVILLSLPSAKEVEAVMLGKDGILNQPDIAGRVIIDLSTSRPGLTRIIYAEAQKRGAHFLDAPVTGGKKGAVAGTLTIMVGGDSSVYSAQSDVLKAIAAKVFYVGSSGMGHTAKIIHNLISTSNIAVLSEAFVMAQKAGVDPKVMMDIINNGAARSYMSETKGEAHILARKFEGAATIDIQIKDLGLALELAGASEMPLPIGSLISQVYQMARSFGLGGKDSAGMVKAYDILSGRKKRPGLS